MARNYSSTASETQVAEAISGSATLLKVSSVVGFPSVPFTLGLDVGTVYEELVTVTGVAGLNLTVIRGEDGTSGLAHQVGAAVRHVVSARDLREPQDHLSATSNVHGVTGSLVGTTNTQTLSNKTLNATNNINTGALPSQIEVARLRLSSVSDASESSTTHALQVGPTDGSNLRLDNNEIVSLVSGAPAKLYVPFGVNTVSYEASSAGDLITKGFSDGRRGWFSEFAPEVTGERNATTRYYGLGLPPKPFARRFTASIFASIVAVASCDWDMVVRLADNPSDSLPAEGTALCQQPIVATSTTNIRHPVSMSVSFTVDANASKVLRVWLVRTTGTINVTDQAGLAVQIDWTRIGANQW